MSTREKKTITEFMIEEQRRFPEATGDFTAVLNHVRLACKRISFIVGRGALGAAQGDAEAINVQGETQMKLDVIANDIFLRTSEYGGHLAGMVSEELEDPIHSGGVSARQVPARFRSARRLEQPRRERPGRQHFLGARGAAQRRARVRRGLPAARIAAAVRGLCDLRRDDHAGAHLGRGVHGFTLDRGFGEFVLTHPNMTIAGDTSEFAINASNERFWEPPVKRYVVECLQGHAGLRGKDFNMRWIASLVAEVHRILIRGGLFMYPRDTKVPSKPGRLRLLYEANPMAMIVEQAGGAASWGRGRVLDCVPDELHQRVPLILGCRSEVERIERYHLEHDQGLDRIYSSPLFKERSLFIQSEWT
jgi:fructose-1,6-bisphosphatase